MRMDLAAYFQRIGYPGPAAPTLDTLREIHRLHPQAIAFENLDPLRGAPVELGIEQLEQKLVRGGRGGYCFEHNLLLREALLAIGFGVRALAARVVWGQPPGALTARSHMLLRVTAEDEQYIADVGFGGQVLTGPLRLAANEEQATPHEPFRLFERDGMLTLESLLGGSWMPLYRFDLHEQHPIDYTATNYYLSTSPASHFTKLLIAARTEPGRRYALRNNALAIHRVGAASERVLLSTVAELRHALETTFRIAVPVDPALDAALERVLIAAQI